MKKTNIAKRIVSIVLAMSIVLSFALVSVSAAVPKGATVDESRTKTNGFETGRMFTSAAPKDHYALSSEVVRTGAKSVKIQTKDATAVLDGTTPNTAAFYINTNGSWYPYDCNPAYYYCVTMYAYTTGSADISLHSYNGQQWGEAFHISGGTWIEVSWVFQTLGSNMFYIGVNNAVGSDVYFDDFEFKEITAVADFALTQSNFEFDYDTADAAVVEYTSTVDLNSVTVTAPEGVTATGYIAGDKLTVDLSGVEIGGVYNLTITGKDAFYRNYSVEKSIAMPSTLPISIVGSSISGVVSAPVGVVYVDAEEAINSDTLGGIAIVGENATVTGATLVDADTIRVELSGVLPAESYTLKFDGVASVNGGLLTDTISFSTLANGSYKVDFESGIPADKFAHVNMNNNNGTYELANEGYKSSKSIMMAGDDYAMGAVAMELQGFKPNANYLVSFYYKSATWKQKFTTCTGGAWKTSEAVFTTAEDGWSKCTIPFTANGGAATLQLYNFLNGNYGNGTIYVDDLKVQEVSSVCQPVMVNNGRYVSELGLGTTTVEIPVTNANAKAYIVSYDEQGRMVDIEDAAASNGAINLTWTATTPAYETKIIVMDATTFAPLCDAIVY